MNRYYLKESNINFVYNESSLVINKGHLAKVKIKENVQEQVSNVQQCCSIIISNSSGNSIVSNSSNCSSLNSNTLYTLSKYVDTHPCPAVCVCVWFVSFSLLFLYHETLDAIETLPQVAALDPNVVCTASVDLSALCQHPLHSPATPAPFCIYLCSTLAGIGYIYNRFVNAIFSFDFLAAYSLINTLLASRFSYALFVYMQICQYCNINLS